MNPDNQIINFKRDFEKHKANKQELINSLNSIVIIDPSAPSSQEQTGPAPHPKPFLLVAADSRSFRHKPPKPVPQPIPKSISASIKKTKRYKAKVK